MSRSHKKVWGSKDRNPWAKNYANRKLRYKTNVPNGGNYKKFTQSYDICDWKFFWYSKQEFLEFQKRWEDSPYPVKYWKEYRK